MGENVDTFREIYLERERYLLNIDELLEEMHGKTKSEIKDNLIMDFGLNAGTVCCGTLVDTEQAQGVEMKASEQLFVCSNKCRKFAEIATS